MGLLSIFVIIEIPQRSKKYSYQEREIPQKKKTRKEKDFLKKKKNPEKEGKLKTS
jgi:hypothetical protein